MAEKECPTCRGNGVVVEKDPKTGKIDIKICPTCNGRRTVPG